jgi:hypothetical protein
MKYKPGVEFAGLIVKENKGRELICICMKCQEETRIALTSISRKVQNGRRYCKNCLQRRTDDNYIIESAIYDFKKKAESRDLSWSLNFDQVKDLITQDCHYCSASPFSSRFKKMPWNSEIKINGIDRKNNNVGYEIKNCVPCCGICNRAKSSMTYESFLEYIDRIRGSK